MKTNMNVINHSMELVAAISKEDYDKLIDYDFNYIVGGFAEYFEKLETEIQNLSFQDDGLSTYLPWLYGNILACLGRNKLALPSAENEKLLIFVLYFILENDASKEKKVLLEFLLRKIVGTANKMIRDGVVSE